MKKKRRTEITVETSLLVIRRTGGRRQAEIIRCAECPSTVPLVTPEEAAVVARVSTRAIYAWVEAGRLHFAETAEGQIRVCLDSLLT